LGVAFLGKERATSSFSPKERVSHLVVGLVPTSVLHQSKSEDRELSFIGSACYHDLITELGLFPMGSHSTIVSIVLKLESFDTTTQKVVFSCLDNHWCFNDRVAICIFKDNLIFT